MQGQITLGKWEVVKVPGVTMPLWYRGPYILAGFELSCLNGGLLALGVQDRATWPLDCPQSLV